MGSRIPKQIFKKKMKRAPEWSTASVMRKQREWEGEVEGRGKSEGAKRNMVMETKIGKDRN